MRIVTILILALASFAHADESVSVRSLMKELGDPLAIARFPDPSYRLIQSSSYDPASKTPDDAKTWFANDDCGKFIRVDKRDGREESVMLDVDGPGAVVRVWSPNPKGVMRVYIDGADKPIIEAKMEAVLDGTDFYGDAKKGFPLASAQSRGWNLYVPIPFAKRCLITTDDGKGVYYQVDWRKYDKGTNVDSCSLGDVGRFEARERVPKSLETPSGLVVSGSVPKVRAGGSSMLFKQDGSSGCLMQVRLVLSQSRERPPTTSPWSPQGLATLVLRGDFDGERTVDVPLGEFCSSSGESTSSDARRWASSSSLVIAWPMPFEKSAQLSLVNLGANDVEFRVINTVVPWSWDSRSMHFHATWHRDSKLHTRPMRDFNYVTVQGQGVYAGDSLHVVNPVDAWWGEGDEKIYVDGESFPSSFGTGTEDYYGYGWCCPEPFQHPLHSQTVCDGKEFGSNYGRTIVARLRGLDGIPFTKSLRFDMEIWHWAECDFSYAATTFWYAKPGATCNVKLDEAEVARGRSELPPAFVIKDAIECESLKVQAKSEGINVGPQSLRSFGANRFSKDHQLWVQGKKVGDFVEIAIPTKDDAPTHVTLHVAKSWDYGIVQFAINGKDAGAPIDLWSGKTGKVEPASIDLGTHAPKNGVLTLRATVVGGNEKSEGTRSFFGLDAVVLKPGG